MLAHARQKSGSALIFFALLALNCEGQAVIGAQYRIAGTVVSSNDGHPLARVRVILADVKNPAKPRSLLSSENGSFAFSGLPAGKYSLQGAKRGYLTRSYDQHEVFSTAIVTGGALDTEHLVLKLLPNAYIVGKILDENGDPVRRANVMLYRVAHEEGTSEVQQSRTDNTDDLGAYELGPVPPGTYFVTARATPWYAFTPPRGDKNGPSMQVDPAVDSAYPLSYYGDTSDPDSATPIQVRGGDRVQADIHLAPVPSRHFLIRVPQGSFPQVQEIGLGGETRGVQANLQPTEPGIWDLSGLGPGKYQLSIVGPGGSTVSDLSAMAEDQEIDATAAAPLGSVNITVQVAGQITAPDQVWVGLRVPRGILRYLGLSDSKGVGHFQGVAAGRYEVVAWDRRGRFALSHLAATGGQLAGAAVELGAGSTANIAVTLTRGRATIEGIAKREDQAIAGAMVVLVPDNLDEHLDLIRRDQTDFDGTFTLNAVVPGKYTLLAIENGWDLDWSSLGVLAPYLKRGLKVNVISGDNGALKISEPLAVQQRQ